MNTILEDARELFNYAHTNPNGQLYLKSTFPTLERKIRDGKYDRGRALKLVLRNARDVAKAYCMEYCGNLAWPIMFPPATREEWANQILNFFEAEIAAGNSYIGKE